MPQVAAAYKNDPNAGLDIMIILGENQSQGKPTLDYCKGYASQFGVPIDKIYIDYGNQYGSYETLFSYMNPYLQPDGSFSLPWDAVLDGDNMEYVFCSMAGPYANAEQAINELLAD